MMYHTHFVKDDGSFAVKNANDIVIQQTEDTNTNPERLFLAQNGKELFVNQVLSKGSKGGPKQSLDLIAENQNKTNLCHSVI